ncbi:MAG: hypothetical protein HY841_00635 [Bacteroidetes bacterium]|nr:hypothetical protein [Bacteroidota bacterium]
MHPFYLLYIDPGIGSLAAQVIIAGFAAFMIFFKNSFRKLFSFWKKDRKKENQKKISE